MSVYSFSWYAVAVGGKIMQESVSHSREQAEAHIEAAKKLAILGDHIRVVRLRVEELPVRVYKRTPR